jgi:thimet oligopeptidase
MLQVASRLYGLKFVPAEVPKYLPDMQYYDVLDGDDKYIGGIYLDLYPNANSGSGASGGGVLNSSRIAQRIPIASFAASLNRDGLNLIEVETLFHEFGHVLHGVLSTTDYLAHGGTGTTQDFVEAPSQMFEEWARRPESLAILKQVCSACPELDAQLFKRLNGARKFGLGIYYSQLHTWSEYDIALVDIKPADALQTWQIIEGGTQLGHVPGTHYPSSFSHLMREYSAGYYGYLWSQVLAIDMLSAFGDNIMNPQVGRRFRDTILANGGEQAPKQLVEKFLGRPTNSKAFFEEITGKR